MGLRPGNPVVGGNTLRRAAIQSPDYVPGVSGWSINQDGTAEFNGIILLAGASFIGTDYIFNQFGAFFYTGTPAPANELTGDSAAFAVTLGNWTNAGVCTVARVGSPLYALPPGASGAMMMTGIASGNAEAASCLASKILTEGIACAAGDQIPLNAMMLAGTTGRTVNLGAQFYTAAGAAISTLFGPTGTDDSSGYTFISGGPVTAPATAAFYRMVVEIVGIVTGEQHLVSLPFTADSTANPGNLYLAIAGEGGYDNFGNQYGAGVDSFNVTLHNGQRAQLAGGVLILQGASLSEIYADPATGNIVVVPGSDVTQFDGTAIMLPSAAVEPVTTPADTQVFDFNGWPKAIAAADGALYSLGVQEYSASVAQTFGGAIVGSGGAINGLSAKLAPGKYIISGQIDVSPTQAAGDGLLQFGGTATVSSMRVTVREELNGTPGANGNATTLTALLQQFTSATFTLPGRQWKFTGTITVSAGGTLIVQGGSSAAADTWSTHIDGTYYTIRPHNP